MRKMRTTHILLAIAATLLFITATASATIWEHEKDHTKYGKLKQWDLGDIGPGACGPTSVINSFVYLQNEYPGIYDHDLVPDLNGNGIIDYAEMVAAGLDLAGFMGTTADGTDDWDFVWGKWDYMEWKVPGKTIYHGMDTGYWDPDADPRPGWLENATPTWRFLYDMLVACEDVEIGITYPDDGGHWLTLTSIHWDDVLNTGWIDYIDPHDGLKHLCDMDLGPNGELRVDYGPWGTWIDIAVAESPIPSPAALALLMLGAAIVSRRRR